ncbi:MAG: hypothetical protein J07HX5_00353 [halophilic archaeon J07HX5]|nr:MAG: hypothetical protein J07HX5_00353 [halophilic archaeon J07HX5]
MRTCALCIVPAELVTGAETTTLPTVTRPADAESRAETAETWLDESSSTRSDTERYSTHPPVADRVARLQRLAAELEGQP